MKNLRPRWYNDGKQFRPVLTMDGPSKMTILMIGGSGITTFNLDFKEQEKMTVLHQSADRVLASMKLVAKQKGCTNSAAIVMKTATQLLK